MYNYSYSVSISPADSKQLNLLIKMKNHFIFRALVKFVHQKTDILSYFFVLFFLLLIDLCLKTCV